MQRANWLRVLSLILLSLPASAQNPELSKTVQEFVRVHAARIVLMHVRIVDGTGAPAVEDENLVIEAGKIAAIQKGADVSAAEGTAILSLPGYTVMPGIIGMHNHLFYAALPNLDSKMAL